MDPHIVTAESASKVWNWLQTRGGLAIWQSQDLGNLGQSWTTPRLTVEGSPYGPPHWSCSREPQRIITDPAEVAVSVDQEVKRFHVAVRMGSQGLRIKCTDASSRRIRSAVEKAGKNAYHVFDYSTQEAVIFRQVSQKPIAEFIQQ